MFIVLQNGTENPSTWPLGATPLVIGRSAGCDIRVFDRALSRRHTRIWLEDDAVRFEDLGSANATLVNGSPAHAGTLQAGDTLSAGATLFQITAEDVPKLSREPGPEATPITISAALAAYARDPEETSFETPTYRTIHELHDLFHLGRLLGAVESVEALTSLLERTLREHFEPHALWIAWQYGTDQPLHVPLLESDVEAVEAPLELLQRALKAHEGLVTPSVHRDGEKNYPQTVMAVPLVHAEEVLGGFAICGRAPGRTYAEDDLHYALGIASIVAPHVRAVRHAEQLRRDNAALQARVGSGTRLLGESPSIARARDLIVRAADTTLPVLLLGETGTGKEVAARELHDASRRHEGPYVVVNCAAIPEELFESEMFGHEKGSFTGAHQRRIGCFEEANGGTLFLDEVGDLAPQSQARLLRAIETGTFRRVGGQQEITVDVRIVSATNKLVGQTGGNMTMRDDLYHRLCGFEIHLPPLGERTEDIPILAEHFLALLRTEANSPAHRFAPKAMARLLAWHWPGNVRELRACIARAVAVADGPDIQPDDILLQPALADIQGDSPPPVTLADAERQHILRVLRQNRGNIRATARALDISRTTLYKKFEDYGIEP